MAKALFITKRKLFFSSKAAATSCLKLFKSIFHLVFAKRQILFVTKQKIKTVNFGPLSQLCLMIAISWVISLFYSSIQYNKIISQKSEEISRLETMASYYDTEFKNLNDKLSKVSNYISSIALVNGNKEKDAKKTDDQSFKLPDTIKLIKISKDEEGLLGSIKTASLTIDYIDSITDKRLEAIENTLAKTGLKIKDRQIKTASFHQQKKLKNLNYGQGGPYISLQNYSAQELAMKNLSDFEILDTAKFADKIDKLISLETMIKFIPFARPISKKFVSSGFGPRTDPITGGMAMHQGIDFVGSKGQKITSPSMGTVIKAGSYYDYGNAVVLDHGYGITSRYGHLSKVLVKEGQTVKKGDLLGLQGSTGRSTGEHLHYEIRYKNNPLDPKKFFRSGDAFFQNNKVGSTS